MDLRKVLIHSRKLPAQHVEELWETVYKHNVKVETLSAILSFYLHHRIYPPPVQKAFDSLLIAFTGAKVPRKLRTLLFQTVEEMCHWLSPSCVTDTVRLSTSPSVAAGLLPCFFINKDIPLPSTTVYEWLISSLSSPGLCLEDRARVLGFLMTSLPAELTPSLNKQLTSWLSYCRSPQTTAGLFRSADVTELDGSPAIGICTALTLVTTITDLHYLSLVAFSGMRRYLRRWGDSTGADPSLAGAVCGYCSAILAQAAKRPSHHQDKLVVAAVLEEVVLVLTAVRRVDPTSAGKCQLMMGTVLHLAELLKSSSLLVHVWEYQITQGESSLTERVLGAVVKSEFSQGVVSHKIATVLTDHGRLPQLARHMVRYTPNILKLVATHPSTLVEEFMDIVGHLASASDHSLVTEVLHCLLDLPTLSASICLHQSALLVQAGFKVPLLVSARQQAEVEPGLNSVFVHMMRVEAKPGEYSKLFKLYPEYWSLLRPLLTLGLVDVCAQITPLLLQAFLDAIHNNKEANKLIFPELLSRSIALCPIPAYQKSVDEVISQYIVKVCQLQPDLVELAVVVDTLSFTSACLQCPSLYEALVTVVGEHLRTEHTLVGCFDSLEAVLREYLLKTTKDLNKLETSVCLAIAKLASRNNTVIPRAVDVFNRVIKKHEVSDAEDKRMSVQQTKELIRILKNPRLASVVLTPSCKEDSAVAALVRVLFQFLD